MQTVFHAGFTGGAMNAFPFSVYKRSDRPFYSVSFKDASGKYLPAISTKQTTETEAVQVAFRWLRDGIAEKDGLERL
jgi:hypothetical protein